MVKKRKSIALSVDIIDFVDDNRGHISFSSYVETLMRGGVRLRELGFDLQNLNKIMVANFEEEGEGVQPRRTIVRIR